MAGQGAAGNRGTFGDVDIDIPFERMSIYKMIRRLGLEEGGTKKRAPTGDGDSDESTGHG